MNTKTAVDYDYVSGGAVRPRNDNVVIKLEALPEFSKSGLVAMPRSDFTREIDGRAAVVVAVGDGQSYKANCDKCGRPRYPFGMGVKPGDRVIVDNKNCGERVFMNGEEMRIVREAELLAVVEAD